MDKTYTVNGENVTVPTYMTPDVSTFYQEPIGSRSLVKPHFPGFAAKFVNLSPYQINVYWYNTGTNKGIIFHYMEPFSFYGTASFPSHQFYMTPRDREDKIQWFTMDPKNSIYVFDAFELGYTRVDDLDNAGKTSYYKIKHSLEFGKQYKDYTGRDWLSLYPRPPLKHFMWNADYFGQMHSIQTTETHFLTKPPRQELNNRGARLYSYRDPLPLNLTLKVISCRPRAFEIEDFLSDVEVQHILDLTTTISLQKSQTGTSGRALDDDEVKVRTSRNTWVSREQTPIIDAIYRRAADLLKIDEALFRDRADDEVPNYPSKRAITESLQLVHYNVGEEYTAHHDAAYPPIYDEHQSTRYATLLLYLNEGMKGGETSFPRWENADTGEELKTAPKSGKAVLFYSYLSDGNIDDLSQHAAKPVLEGEKWLMNLWVWDAFFR